jgi:hypothetical protein
MSEEEKRTMEYVIKCCDGSGCDECTSSDEEDDDDKNGSVCFRVTHEYNEDECSDNCPHKPGKEEDDEDDEEEDDAKSANSSTYGAGCRRICRMCGKECSCWNYNDDHEVVCEDCTVVAFYCAECDDDVIKDSRAHDNALTHDGKRWWCMNCYDAWKSCKEE